MTTSIEIPAAVLSAARAVIAESLVIEPDSIHLESRLIDDLGADSLDFVDIVFSLEQELDVKMRESELSVLTRLDFSSPEVMREGHLTAEVIDRLEPWLPEIGRLPDRTKVTPRNLFSLITVEAICLVAARRLPGA